MLQKYSAQSFVRCINKASRIKARLFITWLWILNQRIAIAWFTPNNSSGRWYTPRLILTHLPPLPLTLSDSARRHQIFISSSNLSARIFTPHSRYVCVCVCVGEVVYIYIYIFLHVGFTSSFIPL